MQIYTSNLSRILRHSAIITLFFLPSVATFAMQDDGQEDVSKTPSIQPSGTPSVGSDVKDLSIPLPSASPSVQAVDPELRRLEEELKVAQLRQQLAEQKMRTQAAEKKLAEEEEAASFPVNPAELLMRSIIKGLTSKRSDEHVGHNVSTELARGKESLSNFFAGKGWKSERRLAKDERKQLAKTTSSFPSPTTTPSPAPFSSIPSPAFKEPESPSLSAAGTPRTYRTTGENQRARSKHSAISLQLPNKDLQDDAFQLIVNHRTAGKGPIVRVYDPKTKTYTILGSLPPSPSFRDTTFNLSSWANTVRDEPFAESVIATYLSFLGGKSDLHSFTIQSGGKTVKKVVFGDTDSESQSGVHIYAPETDQDANEWSRIRQ